MRKWRFYKQQKIERQDLLNKDYSEDIQDQGKQLVDYMNEARNKGHAVRVAQDKARINKEEFSLAQMREMESKNFKEVDKNYKETAKSKGKT